MRTANDEKIVLCMDRDHTVSVNPAPNKRAVPIGHVQFWAHKTDIPVFATGNQHLRVEAEIPGLQEVEYLWEQYTGEEYEYSNSQFKDYLKPRRRDGLRLIQDLYETVFPDEDFRFIVVDDVDVSDLSAEGPWVYYEPWDFVEAVESGESEVEQPPENAFTNDGIPFNSTDDPDFDHDMKAVFGELREAVQGRRTEA